MNIDDLLGPILQVQRHLKLDDSVETLPSWDSTRQVDVILAVEEALGSDLTTSEIDRLKSIRDVLELFRARGIQAEISGA
jgi:acyl carrier protein